MFRVAIRWILVMDFTDPIIRGMSLFHCHLLKHEDKGMMAKILFR